MLPHFLFACILIIFLLALAIIDFKTFLLPDLLTLPLIAIGFGYSYFAHADIIEPLVGAVIGYCGFVLIEIAYKKARGQDGLGRGDAKLFAAGGAWCGWFGLPFILLIASASGLAHAFLLTRKSGGSVPILPFGPHLALGIVVTWLTLSLA